MTEEGLERIPMYRTLVEYVSKTQHDAEELRKQIQSANEESAKLKELCTKLELGLEVRMMILYSFGRLTMFLSIRNEVQPKLKNGNH